MAKVIYYVASSLDGFIAGTNGDISWLHPFEQQGEDYGYEDFYKSVDRLIMGARTYEQIPGLGSWPYKDRPVHVVTHRHLDWYDPQVSFHTGGLRSWVGPMKSRAGKDIWLVGGGILAGAFCDESLLDELIVTIIPILLGAGVPLLKTAKNNIGLDLIAQRPFKNGVIQLHYNLRKEKS